LPSSHSASGHGYAVSCSSSALAGLDQLVFHEISRARGTYEVAIYDFQTGESVLVNAHRFVHAASLIKLPIMMSTFSLVDRGEMTLDDRVCVREWYKSLVNGALFHVDPIASLGDTATIRQLLKSMVTVSDNVAANALIEHIGINRIGDFFASQNYTETSLIRFLMDEQAHKQHLDNTMSAYDAMRMLRDIEQERGLQHESCSEMLNLLLAQMHNEKIPAVLPTQVKIAHKTGSIAAVEHDAGIIYLPNGRKYILVFMSADLPDNQTGINAARAVSRTVYARLTSGARQSTP
jgi:beta-lactamase class A